MESSRDALLPSHDSDRQTISLIEISIEAGKLLGGKHVELGVVGIEPMPS
jgi:hypothetical protein